MMKAKIDKARVIVKARFKSEGSVLAETVRAQGLGFDVRLEINSAESSAHVASVIHNAENGCYVLQTILHPVPVAVDCVLNGKVFDPRNGATTNRKDAQNG